MLLDDGRVDIDCNSKLVRSLTAVYRGPARKSPKGPAPEYSAASGQQTAEWATKLNVVIQVVGSRGDVQPFVALGTELQRHGHRVRLATHNIFDKFVRDAGLEFYPVGGNPAELMAYMVKNPSLIPSMGSLVAGEVQKKRHMVEEMLDGFWDSCLQDDPVTGKPFVADAIIANPPSFAHVHCAQALGIPVHLMFTMPWSNTRSFPHPLANLKNVNGDVGIANYLSYDVVEWMTWQGLGDIVNKWRRLIDLEDVAMFDGPMLTKSLNIPFTCCWSPALVPKPDDWPSHIDVCGFFFRDAPKFAPPADLVQFIESGPAPIYIGFGSIVLDDPDKVLRTILDAVRATGVRAIISKGWSDMPGSDSPDIYWIAECPHEWLFQHVCAVVHHGGAGTTACGLRNGKPTIIVPFFGEYQSNSIIIETTRWDPIFGGASAVMATTVDLTGSVTGIFTKPVKEWRNDRRQRARDLQNLESENSSSVMHHGHSQDQKGQTSLDGRSSSDSNLAASTKFSKKQGSLAGRMAGASAKSIGNFAPTALKGMLVDIPLAITEGLNSVPKMYGGTVRDNGQVTDAKSGAIVAGKTFARGFVDGFTDLVVEPYNGARKDGALGAVKGLGMGAVSLTTKSGAAMFGLLAYPSSGISKSLRAVAHSRTRGRIALQRHAEGAWLVKSGSRRIDSVHVEDLVSAFNRWGKEQ
ncbi:sterol glucosyltransferase [Beauveria bassiana ARSEF 2860]|uniref:Sterol glucosyltransferase n=1 Tax=Beauveria bassiana (strain ARSEF 2860) TaxID=655819 RepID=J5JBR3_BEAB2|nr:sterol glucosyltransferase [Beauveria bassiana ARSEF 2860]EJP63533.1 sterol glucosyltransferase [Beauveria bassiana ARSEF 2860]